MPRIHRDLSTHYQNILEDFLGRVLSTPLNVPVCYQLSYALAGQEKCQQTSLFGIFFVNRLILTCSFMLVSRQKNDV